MVIYPSNTHNPVGNSNICQSNETSLYPNQLFLFSTNYILDNFINNIIKERAFKYVLLRLITSSTLN